jgi:hypothetical protein
MRMKSPAAAEGTSAVLGPFWTLVVLIGAAVWFLLLAVILGDLFRRDVRVAVKVCWTVVLVVFPYVGVIGYLMVQGPGLVQRRQTRKDRAGAP